MPPPFEELEEDAAVEEDNLAPFARIGEGEERIGMRRHSRKRTFFVLSAVSLRSGVLVTIDTSLCLDLCASYS